MTKHELIKIISNNDKYSQNDMKNILLNFFENAVDIIEDKNILKLVRKD